ncbi:MAG: DNA gyrase inhibitor YacG [Asticcacaulis sp.]
MIRKCTRCQKPYGEALDGVVSAARDYAPFCSKRCADVDLVHWLKGDYVLDGSGSLAVNDEEDAPAEGRAILPYEDEED